MRLKLKSFIHDKRNVEVSPQTMGNLLFLIFLDMIRDEDINHFSGLSKTQANLITIKA